MLKAKYDYVLDDGTIAFRKDEIYPIVNPLKVPDYLRNDMLNASDGEVIEYVVLKNDQNDYHAIESKNEVKFYFENFPGEIIKTEME